MAKNFEIWGVDASVAVHPDSLPDKSTWEMHVTACRGEVEHIQIALRTEGERVAIHLEVEDLVQALGDTLFGVSNLQLRLVEGDRLIPLPDPLVLEPHHTQAVWLTAVVPKEIEPCAYQGNITLRTDAEEIEALLAVKALDIEMPAADCVDLKKFAQQYGLERLADQELDEREPESSVRWERLRDAREDLRLLWVLEQAQIEAAKQRGADRDAFDPTACGRKICAPIMGGLTDDTVDVSALRAVRDDIIAAIRKTRIPYVDAGDTLTVKARVAPTTPADFAYGTEGRFYFQFQLEWSPVEKVRIGDTFRLTFRDLFSGGCTFLERPIEAPLSGQTKMILTAEDVHLVPSSYHVRVDVMRQDQSLSPIAPGACQIYVAREGESPKHLLASFTASRMAYMWDEKQGLYYHMLPGNLSPSGDPFDPAARPIYERALRFEIARLRFDGWTGRHPMEVCVPEAQHDGGSGMLRAAGVFRKMGETERACFCEQAVKRIVSAVLARKIETHENGEAGMTFYGPRQQHGILLKLLCDACLYFRDVLGDTSYAKTLYEPIRLIGDYQMAQPNELGASEGKVYDGRVLVGLCTYCLTERALDGAFNKAHVDTTLDFALRMSTHTVLHEGWHDEDGMEGHDGYGTMNALWGFLPARRIALETGRENLAESLKKGIWSAFDFLARTNGGITGHTQWIPSRHGCWCAGDTYEMLNEMERQFGAHKIIAWYRLHLCDRDITYFAKLTSKYGETSSLGSRNALPAYLMACEEFEAMSNEQ
ncbi:MAG: hypothetical protein J7M27_06285 [Candidatus Latescibacteria bacterium]|nr:hypothetical protein [Candidatus Latescibacterota bacterium]